ncbi:hypothetical protein [Effusibacillus lacus]|uniref:Uncharacterized protein n=1 Tax=Effusibacillus lacus TaxID=1348429 RepID=A0A292YIV7_9BACL|nr:hypothetical protein [Effusibacillus lacus]TCS68544.1 hypothetical protein EDD64_14227 [Effusibacillus lacus]GAX88425.1 hypothetical protein EFBL_0034 [Effusibacillus lacus]
MINPYAFFDCLSIGKRLDKLLGNLSVAEVQLFSYLSCLLSLYKNHPVSEWGYQFAGTKDGSPFSREIEDSFWYLLKMGCLIQKGDYYQLTEKGEQQFILLNRIETNNKRVMYHEAACSSLLSLPVGLIREALFNEPELSRVMKLSSTRHLLDGPGLEVIYEHFAALSSAIGVDIQDLLVPSVLWLTFLAQMSQEKQEGQEED